MQTVKMVLDEDFENPRQWEHDSQMVCWHGRYNLGDKHSYDCNNFLRELAEEIDDSLFDYFSYLENEVMERRANFVGYGAALAKVDEKIQQITEKIVRATYTILPLFLYDHSGLIMQSTPFSCIFDSGQVGYIFTKHNGDRVGTENRLLAEVEVYSQYLEGEVYGFVVEESGEEIDSCFGFYGSDPRKMGYLNI